MWYFTNFTRKKKRFSNKRTKLWFGSLCIARSLYTTKTNCFYFIFNFLDRRSCRRAAQFKFSRQLRETLSLLCQDVSLPRHATVTVIVFIVAQSNKVRSFDRVFAFAHILSAALCTHLVFMYSALCAVATAVAVVVSLDIKHSSFDQLIV